MGMQKEPTRPPTSSGYFGDEKCSPTTVGGNAQITNGNEFYTTDRLIEATEIIYAPDMMREDDSYVQGIYREPGM